MYPRRNHWDNCLDEKVSQNMQWQRNREAEMGSYEKEATPETNEKNRAERAAWASTQNPLRSYFRIMISEIPTSEITILCVGMFIAFTLGYLARR